MKKILNDLYRNHTVIMILFKEIKETSVILILFNIIKETLKGDIKSKIYLNLVIRSNGSKIPFTPKVADFAKTIS